MINPFRRIINVIMLKRDPVVYWRNKGAKIGNDCEIYNDAYLSNEPYLVTIGDHVRINSGVQFITHDGGVWVLRGIAKQYEDVDLFGTIIIGNNVHIGSRSIIMPGTKIGNNCIIGVGAIVTKSIPDNSIAVGIPARVIESIDTYICKNNEQFVNTKHMTYLEKKEFLESNIEKMSHK